MSDPTPTADARLQELVFRYLERTDAGEPVSRVVEELLADAEELRAGFLRALRGLGSAGLLLGAAEETFPERLGEYRLLRRLGAGGMGVVYLAHQESLDRRVALKLVRPDQLYFEGSRERFRREVESAARLSHPGIAQLYTVGELDGVPFFAQEYVAGASLEQLLRAVAGRDPATLSGQSLFRALLELLPPEEDGERADADARAPLFTGSWTDACLRIARHVAQALGHAHERGVLHRDVKPANVLVTPAGRVVLVDFGLASVAGTDRMTRSGAQVGSLPYLPPEMLDATPGEVDARADVYSLGVTLYEALTLRLPYRAQSAERLLALIAAGATPPPRRVNGRVPRDVEAVCMCALDRDPGRRYASAEALAEDLGRALELRPIAARPAGPLARAVRWARRRPAAALAVALAVLLVVGAPSWIAVERSAAARDLLALNAELGRALAGESAALARAEGHYAVLLDAVEHVLRQIGDEGLENTPSLQRVRLDVLDRAAAVFDRLRAERPDDLQLAARRALLRGSRGRVLYDLGRSEEAVAELDLAVAELVALEDPADPETTRRVAVALANQGQALFARGRHAEALAFQRRAVARWRALAELEDADALALAALGTALASQAATQRTLLDLDAAEETAREASGWAQDALARAPRDPDALHAAARAETELGAVALARGRPQAAFERFEAATAELERALESAPEDRRLRLLHARTVVQAGRAAYERLDGEVSYARFGRGLALLDALRAEYPGLAGPVEEELGARDLYALLLMSRREFDASRALQEQVARARERRAAADPGSILEVCTAASAFANWANVVCVCPDVPDPDRYALALPIVERGLELLDQALDLDPDYPRNGLVGTFLGYQHAVSLAHLGRPDEALEALGVMESFHGGPESMSPVFLAEAWAEWQTAARRVGAEAAALDPDEALERGLAHLADALDAGQIDAAKMDANRAFDAWRADPRFVELVDAARR